MKRLIVALLAVGLSLGLGSSVAFAAAKERDPEAMFKKLDKNGDGKLTIEEFQGKKTGDDAEKGKKRFSKIDANGDGSVTLEEFKAALTKKK